jgi:hypothetical protein
VLLQVWDQRSSSRSLTARLRREQQWSLRCYIDVVAEAVRSKPAADLNALGCLTMGFRISRLRGVGRLDQACGAAVAAAVVAVLLAASADATPTVAVRSMEAEYAIGLDGPNGLVVASRHGVFRTLDGGRRWSDITPKILDGFYEHVDKIVAFGNRVWLELEGASVFDFLPYSSDGGRVWHSVRFSGALSGLGFANPDDGWVMVTSSNGKRMLYASTDGGAEWRRSPRNHRAALPSVVGSTIPGRGAVPTGLRIRYAIRSPDGLAWAQAWGLTLGTFTPTYLLRSDDGGKTWASVTGR